jgi:hypothetical protein
MKIVLAKMSWWAQPLAWIFMLPILLFGLIFTIVTFVFLLPCFLIAFLDGGKGFE